MIGKTLKIDNSSPHINTENAPSKIVRQNAPTTEPSGEKFSSAGTSLAENNAVHTGLNFQTIKYTLLAASPAKVAAPPAPTAARADLKPLKNNLPSDAYYDGVLVGANGQAYVNADGGRTKISAALLDKVPAVGPTKLEKGVASRSEHTVIYVNGIVSDKQTQFDTMKEIADTTGFSVVGVHNGTQGAAADITECFNDKFVKDNNLAVRSLAGALLGKVMSGKPVHLLAHSQGGLITSRALNDVYYALMKNGERKGMNVRQAQQFAEAKLRETVRVETFGSAADSYPNGPQYVHYINSADSVPMQCGLGSLISRYGLKSPQVTAAAGRGATIRYFNVTHQTPGSRSDRVLGGLEINPRKILDGLKGIAGQEGQIEFDRFFAPHAIDDVYLKFRDDFSVAQRLGTGFDTAPTHRLKRINLTVHKTPATWQPKLTNMANKIKSLAAKNPEISRIIEQKIRSAVN